MTKSERAKTPHAAKRATLAMVERPKPEPYSMMVGVRVRPSEKETIQRYAKDNGVSVDTVLRSALVAAGILAA